MIKIIFMLTIKPWFIYSLLQKEDIVKLLSVIKFSLDCSLIQSALEQCVVLLQGTFVTMYMYSTCNRNNLFS